jgi:hypothetical protein
MSAQPNTAEVVPLRPRRGTQLASEKKWGKAVIALGFSVLPTLLFKAQRRLGLSSNQLIVLLHLAEHWWERDRLPFPEKATLADRMNLSARQVQRYLTELETAGFITRIERFAAHKGQQSNSYDLSGLVNKLAKLEPDFREVKEQAKAVSKRGGAAPAKAAEKTQNKKA